MDDYKSWSGVELDLYKKTEYTSVQTRSRSCHSYWDLIQQNKTIKLLKDICGGYFETDYGKNRYYRPEGQPVPPLASGCHLAYWRFKVAFSKIFIYLQRCQLDQFAKDESSGFDFIDEDNPRLFSNNMLIPYAVAVWENFFRSIFIATLKNDDSRKRVVKKANLKHMQIEQVANRGKSIEEVLADCFSFQRPSIIVENFKLIDSSIDISSALKQPYKRKKPHLFSRIESLVEMRNSIVHTSEMSLELFDKDLQEHLEDLQEAINRAYKQIGTICGFDHIAGFYVLP